MKINLYDFDKTIYDGDSSVDFIFYTFKKHPKTMLVIPKIILFGILCGLHIVSKTKMKEQIFSFAKYLDNIDKDLKEFWETHECNIKKFYLEKDHSNDVIISASPEYILKPMTDKLGVKLMMASRVDKKTGKFDGLNCHDEEKVRRLNEVYDKYTVMESYSDSKSDIPILRLAKKQFIVKGEELIPSHFE